MSCRLVIELRPSVHAVGCIRLTESYPNWAQADTAYEAWATLSRQKGSVVEFVELEEQASVTRRKRSTDNKAETGNVVNLGERHGNCARI